MIKLVEQGLFGNHLVKVDKSVLVRRYNDCLKEMGMTPTELSSFHIDGMGWSPEIAEEQDNRYYLSHGMANVYGIIVSPEQKDASIYMPYHTFDWDLHQMIFEQYETQITDLTVQTGIWFEIDQDISAYRNPSDLLMMELIKVRFKTTQNLMKAAKEQKDLILEFNSGELAWMNKDLRERIIQSGRVYGDLRFRKFEMPVIQAAESDCFYTEAFEGAFVFHKQENRKPLIVLKANNSKVSGEQDMSHVEFNLSDPALLPYLYSENLVSNSLEYYFEHVHILDLQLEHLFAEAVFAFDPDLDIVKLNETQRKGVIGKLIAKDLLSDVYFELEQLIRNIKRSSSSEPHSVSEELLPYLLHPSRDLSKQAKIVVWHMLVHLKPYNPVIQYLFEKSGFYAAFNHWPENKQDWVVSELLKYKKLFYELVK